MLNAFVLMSFDDDLEVLYTDFIRPVLEGCGFKVERANDIENQRNILRDIIEAIDQSDLVIAELTGNNPNVLYELGLAHALKKPVIHLTQVLDEVPFDLRSYRIVEYDRDFSTMLDAKERLANIATAFQQGRARFGNPITDFYGVPTADVPVGEDAQNTSAGTGCQLPDEGEGTSPKFLDRADERGERGFLDYFVDVNDGYNVAAEVSRDVVQALGQLTYDVEEASNEISRIAANPNASTGAAAMAVCRRLAVRVAKFNQDVKNANTAYAEVLERTEDSLEFMVAFQFAHIESPSPEILKQMETLRGLQQTISETNGAILSFAGTIDEMPRMERRLSRELNQSSIEIRALAGYLDRISASVSRALRASGTAGRSLRALENTAVQNQVDP